MQSRSGSRGLRSRPTSTLVATVVAAGLVLSGCGGDDDDGKDRALEFVEFQQISSNVLPPTVLDLTVTQEATETPLEAGQETYIEGLGFFSFRREDLLQATLQISSFSDDARPSEESFQRLIASQVSTGGTPSVVRLGEQHVYLTSTGRQTVAVWFDEDENMYVLSIREEYEQPRSLLRNLVRHFGGSIL